MKKIIHLFILSLLILSLSVVFLSCEDTSDSSTVGSESDIDSVYSDDESIHEHTFSKGWNYDETGHYRPCVCHPDFKDMAEHFDTVDKNGFCDVCQYEMVKPTKITVSVIDNNGNAVCGAEIKIYTQTVEHIVTTDESGLCSASFIYTNSMRAMILSLPSEYKYPEKLIYSISENDLIITVEAQNSDIQ